MAKMSEAPRYNVVSARLTDDEVARLETVRTKSQTAKSDFARQAILEKLEREEGE